jgi:hypothetical protein
MSGVNALNAQRPVCVPSVTVDAPGQLTIPSPSGGHGHPKHGRDHAGHGGHGKGGD